MSFSWTEDAAELDGGRGKRPEGLHSTAVLCCNHGVPMSQGHLWNGHSNVHFRVTLFIMSVSAHEVSLPWMEDGLQKDEVVACHRNGLD